MPRDRILYSSPFIPAEWIAAHGFQPYRLFPASHAGAFPSGTNEGLCPYAKAFVEEAAVTQSSGPSAMGAAVIFATTCDQMRRASEGTPPAPEQLAAVMRAYDDARAALRDARPAMRARAAAEALVALHQEGPATSVPRRDGAAPAARDGPRLALLGGPVFRDHYNLYDELEAAGVRVVLDATETGERTLPALFERARLQRDPFGELARAYFEHIPDVFRRPNTLLYEWLDRELAARGVQGILLLRCVWCDLWHAEAPRVKERFHLPVAEMDPSGTAAVGPGKESRLQALLEIFT
ncbi:MAG: 2-hydroxyacyl-CoA dehydratase family protein [Planctomycetota bacterium]|nr:2-hydroxyacyl-CoA dehydratase family protein [Planctomycetota bacterium]